MSMHTQTNNPHVLSLTDVTLILHLHHSLTCPTLHLSSPRGVSNSLSGFFSFSSFHFKGILGILENLLIGFLADS